MITIKKIFAFALPIISVVLHVHGATYSENGFRGLESLCKDCFSALSSNSSGSSAATTQQCMVSFDSDNKKCTSNTNSSPPGSYSDADSKSVINYINNTFEPDIRAMINALVAKKSTLTASQKSSICEVLKMAKTNLECWCGLASKCVPAADRDAVKSACSKAASDFSSGISSFCPGQITVYPVR